MDKRTKDDHNLKDRQKKKKARKEGRKERKKKSIPKRKEGLIDCLVLEHKRCGGGGDLTCISRGVGQESKEMFKDLLALD